MPTRKQRRRREKEFRHEYETVLLDADGNELPVDEDEVRAARLAREKARAKPARGGKQQQGKQQQGRQQGKGRSRPVREAPPPSWRRAVRRGGLMGGGMFVLFVFVLHGGSQTSRALTGVVYAVAFIPLTYWADRLAYRTYLRKSGATPPGAGEKKS